jgi:hypothetical protein
MGNEQEVKPTKTIEFDGIRVGVHPLHAPGSGHKAHILKSWPEYFELSINAVKPFELRYDDRGFNPGDKLILREWDPNTGSYTGRIVGGAVTCIVTGYPWLMPGFVALGFRREWWVRGTTQQAESEN